MQADELPFCLGRAADPRLPVVEVDVPQMLSPRPPVVEKLHPEKVGAIGKVQVVVEVGEPDLVEPSHALDELRLERDVGAVELAPAGVSALDARVVELDPPVQPPHERVDSRL